MNEKIKKILSKYKTIAMVGVSKDDKKLSTIVMKYMQKYGFKVIPVNPSAKGEKILGEEVFAKLEDIKTPVNIVDVFRPSVETVKFTEETRGLISIGSLRGSPLLIFKDNEKHFIGCGMVPLLLN